MMTKRKALVVLEAGALLLKFSFYDASPPTPILIARGQFTSCDSRAEFNVADDQGVILAHETVNCSNGGINKTQAFEHLVNWLNAEFGAHLAIAAVGHRVTHGGVALPQPALLHPELLDRLKALVPLAPRHQAHNLAGIEAVCHLRPDLPQVACFDTAFHRGRSDAAERYGLPEKLFQRGLRRWGFHGLAYESAAAHFSRIAPALAIGRVIAAHLGDETSICAMRGGRSIDVSAGFSILEGLPGARSSGTIDPAAILYLLPEMPASQIETLLYEQGGLLGVSHLSGNMKDLLSSGEANAVAAVEFFVYRTVREIGSMAAALGGLDVLLFTDTWGETCPEIRERICRGLSWLGITLELRANHRGESCISKPGRSPSVWIAPCDVHNIIAVHSVRLVGMATPRLIHRPATRDNPA
ncbi:MAG: acetate/propionate family kinase [Phycisphaerae bacterium]